MLDFLSLEVHLSVIEATGSSERGETYAAQSDHECDTDMQPIF